MDDIVADKQYDEAIPVETDDEELSTPGSSEAGSPTSASGGPPSKPNKVVSPARKDERKPPPAPGNKAGQSDDSGSEDGSDSDKSESSTSSSGASQSGGAAREKPEAGAYNPDEYKGMKVSNEVEELFQYITRYKPHTIELDTSFKPFVPELIPSIGEVDAFLKMPMPDGKDGGLGTVRLDEPCLNASDPSILDLQLRSLSKHQDLEPMDVRSIENAEKCPKEVENWVKRIDDLNRSKPAPTVQYSRRMPDIEQLMQVWPSEFEEYLQENPLPDLADLDIDLPNYIRLVASILDVPVYSQLTETLHVIFTLYSEFKANQHFSKAAETGMLGDQYNFPGMQNFGQAGNQAAGASAAASNVFGQPSESMAPSRAPSPVGGRGGD